MSFVPAPQQAGASSSANASNNAAPPAASVTPTPEAPSEGELTFKTRSYDVFWIEKHALMYKDGITKVGCLCFMFELLIVFQVQV
jgi:hypothetical protein